MTLAHDPCIKPLPVTFVYPTQIAELSWLKTSLQFSQKYNFLKVLKFCSVNTWRLTWFFCLYWASSFDQLTVFVIRLTILQKFLEL